MSEPDHEPVPDSIFLDRRLVYAALMGMDVTPLLANGADVNAVVDGSTPLIHAAFGRNLGVVHLLLRAGANVNAVDHNGQTALMWAVNVSVISALLSAGANVDVRDTNGNTALINTVTRYIERDNTAVQREYLDKIALLLHSHANVNVQNNIGMTALMYAIEGDVFDVVNMLMTARPDVTIRDNNHKTALDFFNFTLSSAMYLYMMDQRFNNYANLMDTLFRNADNATLKRILEQVKALYVNMGFYRRGRNIHRKFTAMIRKKLRPHDLSEFVP